MNCPANQMFDVASNQCRAASSVNCGSRQSTNVDAQQNAVCVERFSVKRFIEINRLSDLPRPEEWSSLGKSSELSRFY